MSSDKLSSVHNALRILRLFTKENRELGITEIGEYLGLPKSTVYRLIHTLCEEQLVEKNQKTRQYYLGLASFELGFAVYNNMELRKAAIPFIDQLAQKLRKVAQLAISDGKDAIYIYKSTPHNNVKIVTQIGSRAPFHCTSVGKVLVAFRNDQEIHHLLENPLKAYTSKTITDPDRLSNILQEVREKGYAVSRDELKMGISSLSVPIFNDEGKIMAALSVAGESTQFLPFQLNNYLKEMKMHSRLIAEQTSG